MKYTCERCGKYSTNRKENLRRHMNRKFPCKKVENEENHFESSENIEGYIIENIVDPVEFLIEEPVAKPTVTGGKKTWKCLHCPKTFSTNSNMHRHMKSCKDYKLYLRVKTLERENDLLQSQVTTINTTNHNTINNNTTNNIIINAYGTENLQHLLPQLPVMIKHFPATAVTDLICETYYDPDHPENKNVKIRSTKEKWAQVYNGSKWEMKQKMDTIMDVLQKSFEFIDDFFETQSLDNSAYQERKMTWGKVRDLWNDDIYPDKEMVNKTEEILTNQSLSNSIFRKIMKK